MDDMTPLGGNLLAEALSAVNNRDENGSTPKHPADVAEPQVAEAVGSPRRPNRNVILAILTALIVASLFAAFRDPIKNKARSVGGESRTVSVNSPPSVVP